MRIRILDFLTEWEIAAGAIKKPLRRHRKCHATWFWRGGLNPHYGL